MNTFKEYVYGTNRSELVNQLHFMESYAYSRRAYDTFP